MINYKNFWKKFYKVKKPPVNNSKFAKFCLKYLKNYKGNVFDIGCGNGRDTIFFIKKKIDVIGLDQSNVIKKNKNFFKKNFVKKKPKGIDPIKYERIDINKISIFIA